MVMGIETVLWQAALAVREIHVSELHDFGVVEISDGKG